MKYIKILLWLFLTTVVYASGVMSICSVSPELLLILTGVFAFYFESIKTSVPFTFVCAVFMAALGGRNFAFCMLACMYFSFVCLYIKKGRHKKVRFCLLTFLYSLIYESAFYVVFCINEMAVNEAFLRVIIPAAVYSVPIALVIYWLFEKSFRIKERFIF